jgi:hypothetical protein
MIFCAVAGPTPWRLSSSSRDAVLMFTGAPGTVADPPADDADPPAAVLPAPAEDPAATVAPRSGPMICWPSTTLAARFTAASSALASGPPASASASATRAPAGTRTTPGDLTAPHT